MSLTITNSDVLKMLGASCFEKLLDAKEIPKERIQEYREKYGWKLRLLYQEYKKAREPFLEERSRILEEFQKKNKHGQRMFEDTGLPVFESIEKQTSANEQLDALLKMEYKLEAEAVQMKIVDIPDDITLALMIDMEPFVQLIEG